MFFRRPLFPGAPSPLVLGLLLTLQINTGLAANPFLGQGGEKKPEVRPPASSGFMVEKQLELKDQIGELLLAVRDGGSSAPLFLLLGLSFIYGILHAAGPGHRKTVLFSLIMGRKTRWWDPLAAAFLAAGLHAGSAVAVILGYRFLTRTLLPAKINSTRLYLEGITYILLILLSLLFLAKVVRRIIRRVPHSHGPASSGGLYSTLAASSFFPCPGAIMILTFSFTLNVLPLGILSVLGLSIGMGVTISLVGYLAYTGRETLFRALKNREDRLERMTAFLEAASFLFLFLFSSWMAAPFLLTLLS